MSELLTSLAKRRSVYQFENRLNHQPEELASTIGQAVMAAPSAFNSQTSRIVLMTGSKNHKVWELIRQAQEPLIDEGSGGDFYRMVFDTGQNAAASLIFFEDQAAVEANIPANPERQVIYKEKNSAITQYTAWVVLADLGYGACLQHFNIGAKEGYDQSIKDLLQVPDSWELNAQMPFGLLKDLPEAKEKLPIDQIIQIQD